MMTNWYEIYWMYQLWCLSPRSCGFQQTNSSFLARSQLSTNIYLPCHCTAHVCIVVHCCGSMWSFAWKRLLFSCICIAVGAPFIKRGLLGSILPVLTPLHFCSKQGLPTFYVVVLFICWGEKRLVRFVDIGEIAYHRHLSFLSIM
jgi:hypothetical protein